MFTNAVFCRALHWNLRTINLKVHITSSGFGKACYHKQLFVRQSRNSHLGPPVITLIAVNQVKTFSFILNHFSAMSFATAANRDYLAVKEKYLELPPEEKRKVYKCGSRFITLDKVPTWAEYATTNGLLSGSSNPINEKVSLFEGDITSLEIDCIVNAANNKLMGGGGVDGAIHSAAGSELKAECATLGGCGTGDAKITGGYKLPAKYIIHTVGPIGEIAERLDSCYCTSLRILKEHNLKSIAFPCISTGVYGYPNEKATHVAIKAVRHWLESNANLVDRVIFCLFLKEDIKIYHNLMPKYFPAQ